MLLSGMVVLQNLVPVRMALRKSAPTSVASVRSAPVRLALIRLAMASIAPFALAPVRSTPSRLATVRFALIRLASVILSALRLEPDRLAPPRSAPSRLELVRSMPERLTPGQLVFRLSTQPLMVWRASTVEANSRAAMMAKQLARVFTGYSSFMGDCRQFTASACFSLFIGRENPAEMMDNRRLPEQHLLFHVTEQNHEPYRPGHPPHRRRPSGSPRRAGADQTARADRRACLSSGRGAGASADRALLFRASAGSRLRAAQPLAEGLRAGGDGHGFHADHHRVHRRDRRHAGDHAAGRGDHRGGDARRDRLRRKPAPPGRAAGRARRARPAAGV